MDIDSGVVYGSLVHEAFVRLWPEKEFNYIVKEEYNRRLGSFNANISLRGKHLNIKYNLLWKNVDSEIQIGLIQHLLQRMLTKNSYGQKLNTYNISLYNNFCKQIPTYVSDDHDLDANCVDLKESFVRMNAKFFDNKLNECSLKWGSVAVRRLASYNFNNDSITVSSLFKSAPIHVLDLLMYHEMLHKDLQFDCKNGRVRTHTSEFKRRENLYPQKMAVEKEIEIMIKGARRSGYGNSVQRKQSTIRKIPILKKLQDFFG